MERYSYAVTGHGITHTMSPFIHKKLFALQGMSAEYETVDMPDISKALEKLRSLSGFNVTIPHKTSIIPFLDEIDIHGRLCKSVNTVKCSEGKLFGYTTDGEGFRLALEFHKLEFKGDVLILGNGGAARAILFEMASGARSITIACRQGSVQRAQMLLEELVSVNATENVQVVSYEELSQSTQTYDLMVNTTSVGMYPKIDKMPVSPDVLERCKALYDIVYNPDITLLMEHAASKGIQVAGGMEMLVFQAVAAHKIWYGGEFERGDIEELCRDARREQKRIFEGQGG